MKTDSENSENSENPGNSENSGGSGGGSRRGPGRGQRGDFCDPLGFWHLRVPRSRPTGGHVPERAILCHCSCTLVCPSVGRIIEVQRAKTRVPNRLGGPKPVCRGRGPPSRRPRTHNGTCGSRTPLDWKDRRQSPKRIGEIFQF